MIYSQILGQIPLDLLYEGATLYDTWTLNGIGMMSGETIKGKVSITKSLVPVILGSKKLFYCGYGRTGNR